MQSCCETSTCLLVIPVKAFGSGSGFGLRLQQIHPEMKLDLVVWGLFFLGFGVDSGCTALSSG